MSPRRIIIGVLLLAACAAFGSLVEHGCDFNPGECAVIVEGGL